MIILLDEYDTPVQEAYVFGYREKMTEFIRGLFHSTFKTNSSLERGILTGITRISKETIFSDLDNLEVVTTTSDRYQDIFGFTKEEVFTALDEYGLSERRQQVKDWYDGFTFGDVTDFSKRGSLEFSSCGRIFESSTWGFEERAGNFCYQLSLTNKEVRLMFENMIRDWFQGSDDGYNDFIKALLQNDIRAMNHCMNKVALATFSYFDTGKNRSEAEPERFYHGFVLGLMVDLSDRYVITSNRESGFGRYDVTGTYPNIRVCLSWKKGFDWRRRQEQGEVMEKGPELRVSSYCQKQDNTVQ